MRAYIYIHSFGEIVENFVIEFDSINELTDLLDYSRKKYGSNDGFCFDVMIL